MQASDVMAQSNVALQLRYLQVVLYPHSNIILELFVDSEQHQHGKELNGRLSSTYRPLQKALPK